MPSTPSSRTRLLTSIKKKTGRSLGQWVGILQQFAIAELGRLEPEFPRMVSRLTALAGEQPKAAARPAAKRKARTKVAKAVPAAASLAPAAAPAQAQPAARKKRVR